MEGIVWGDWVPITGQNPADAGDQLARTSLEGLGHRERKD